MQWRAPVLLLSGIVVIYIAILSQDTPYLHPKKIHTSNVLPFLSFKPDETVITTVGSYVYQTTIRYEALNQKGSLIGTERLKIGVRGIVKQVRRPLSSLLTERDMLNSDGWESCFQHVLKGQISKVSAKKSDNPNISKAQFAVLHHEIDAENAFHYVRVYYTRVDKNNDFFFEYKDIKLPGTTWVNAISLEKDSIIYSRDPDQYEFHILTLPSDLTQSPHSEEASIVNAKVEHGREVQEWSQPLSTEQNALLLSRLYSPERETYRVFTLSIHKTSSSPILHKSNSNFYVNVTIVDKATILDVENKSVTAWFERDKGMSMYPAYNDEPVDYVGFTDVSNYQSLTSNKVNMPELYSTLSVDSKTTVFTYIKNKFLTLDFTDRIDILQLIPQERERLYSNDKQKKNIIKEFYYWQAFQTVDAEIAGVQLNDNGNMLALWTEYDYLYIYKRLPISNTTEETELSWLSKIDKWLDYLLSDTPEEEKELRKTYFAPLWELEMTISPIKDEYGLTKPIGAVHFWQDESDPKNVSNYIFVSSKDGNVNSYSLDLYEAQKVVDFWSFAAEKWDMLFAMSVVISIFVYNEYQRV